MRLQKNHPSRVQALLEVTRKFFGLVPQGDDEQSQLGVESFVPHIIPQLNEGE